MNYNNYNDYELIYRVQENDELSGDILFRKYLPIIRNIAREYYNRYPVSGYDYDDYFQEGAIAFQKALTSYNDR